MLHPNPTSSPAEDQQGIESPEIGLQHKACSRPISGNRTCLRVNLGVCGERRGHAFPESDPGYCVQCSVVKDPHLHTLRRFRVYVTWRHMASYAVQSLTPCSELQSHSLDSYTIQSALSCSSS